MFGFPSFQKLLVLAAVIAIVWYGFKWLTRLQQVRDAQGGGTPKKRRWPGTARRATEEPSQSSAEDMIACPVCGTYVAARGASGCGRADCPY
jgi:hypothetical protein